MRRVRASIACSAAIGMTMALVGPAAAEPASDGWSAGVEVVGLDRSYSIGDDELSGSGVLAGGQVSYQRFPAFRAEARLLAGGLEHEIADTRSSDPAAHAAGKLTWGLPLPNRARLYGGFGVQHLRTELGDDGDETSTTVYLPVGVAKAGALHGGWRAVTVLEARILVGGRHDIDWPPGESAEFDAFGGVGGELSFRVTHPDTPVEIVPYLRFLAAADSRSANFGGDDARLEDLRQAALGLRLGARF